MNAKHILLKRMTVLVVGAGLLVSGGWLIAGTNMEVDGDLEATGDVSIGTTAHDGSLHVVDTISDMNDGIIIADDTAMAAGVGGQIAFYGKFQGSSLTTGGSISAEKSNGNGGDYSFDLAFRTRKNLAGAVTTERMRIMADGKVGIGTTSPDAILEIVGALGDKELILDSSDANADLRFSEAGTDKVIVLWDRSANALEFHVDDTGVDATEHTLVLESGGNVGVGTSSPSEKLDVNGRINLRNSTEPTVGSTEAKLFTISGEMYAKGQGVAKQITSHKDPREFDPNFDSSFGDVSVEMPFSFHHSSDFLGKGAVVDLAAVVRDLEAVTGKSYTVEYDLPEEKILDYSVWVQDDIEQREYEAKMEILAASPSIEVPIQEALETAEILAAATAVESVRRYAIDFEAGEIVEYLTDEVTGVFVGTGEFETRLKSGHWFDETPGTVYRERTLEEVQIAEIPLPQLPQWILDRLPQPE